jgi:hypothetical protein
MERGITTTRLHATGAVLAAVATVSCGAGIHGAEGWFIVSKVMDQQGGLIALREGTLTVEQYSLNAPSAEITLRRQDRYQYQSGAVGPVFEVEVLESGTFTRAPSLSIAANSEVTGNEDYVIGYLVRTKEGYEQWVPDSTKPRPQCDTAGVVCGLVQLEDFTNPGGIRDNAAGVVRLAIVRTCPSGVTDCPSHQECSSGCCQGCVTGGPCND